MPAKKKRPTKAATTNKLPHDLVGLLLIAVGLFSLLSIFTQATGFIGIGTKQVLRSLFGVISYPMPLLMIVVGWLVMISYKKHIHAGKLMLVITLCALTFVFVQLIYDSRIMADAPQDNGFMAYITVSMEYAKETGLGAGLLGATIAFPFVFLLGITGSFVIVIAAMIGALALLTKFSLGDASRKMTDAAVGVAGSAFSKAKSNRILRKEGIEEFAEDEIALPMDRKLHNEQLSPRKPGKNEPELFDIASGTFHAGSIDANEKHRIEEEEDLFVPVGVLSPVVDDMLVVVEKASEPMEASEIVDEEVAGVAIPLHMQPHGVLIENKALPLAGEHPLAVDPKDFVDATPATPIPYTFPPISFLSMPVEPASQGRKALQEQGERSKLLVDTLASFGIEVQVVGVSRGPALTRYELKPASGVKVSRITGLADDIAMNMAAVGVRIEAPIPGKAAVGIEVPNLEVSTVTLREVIESDEFKNHPSRLAFALGRDIAGKPVIADLARMPHLLIAGATGSGKSVCINSLIASILYKATPEEVKLIMIDPKVVELSVYNGIPHLLVPVVTDPKKAAGALNWAVMEMTDRYKKFAESGCRDLKGYNEFARENKIPTLAQLVVIIDELADLMMVAPRDVEDYVCRLAQLARAAGIHLVIATQRPSVNVITGVIKANIPSRIAFSVASQVDSRTILDMAGAEKLLGRGDMLFDPSGANKAMRVQGCFISDKEVTNVVESVKGSREEGYDPDILEALDKADTSKNGAPGGMEEDEGDLDELLNQVIELAIDAGQISTSMLQRRFRIGYARAGRLIDEMEQRGIISGFEGSKPRTTIISKEEYHRLSDKNMIKPSQNVEKPRVQEPICEVVEDAEKIDVMRYKPPMVVEDDEFGTEE